jgi:ribosomal protein L37E
MTGAAWVICERCGERCFHYSGNRCAACKRKDKAAAKVREAERARAQERRGRVGDEQRAAAVLADFDALARQVREAAGVGRRS